MDGRLRRGWFFPCRSEIGIHRSARAAKSATKLLPGGWRRLRRGWFLLCRAGDRHPPKRLGCEIGDRCYPADGRLRRDWFSHGARRSPSTQAPGLRNRRPLLLRMDAPPAWLVFAMPLGDRHPPKRPGCKSATVATRWMAPSGVAGFSHVARRSASTLASKLRNRRPLLPRGRTPPAWLVFPMPLGDRHPPKRPGRVNRRPLLPGGWTPPAWPVFPMPLGDRHPPKRLGCEIGDRCYPGGWRRLRRGWFLPCRSEIGIHPSARAAKSRRPLLLRRMDASGVAGFLPCRSEDRHPLPSAPGCEIGDRCYPVDGRLRRGLFSHRARRSRSTQAPGLRNRRPLLPGGWRPPAWLVFAMPLGDRHPLPSARAAKSATVAARRMDASGVVGFCHAARRSASTQAPGLRNRRPLLPGGWTPPAWLVFAMPLGDRHPPKRPGCEIGDRCYGSRLRRWRRCDLRGPARGRRPGLGRRRRGPRLRRACLPGRIAAWR